MILDGTLFKILAAVSKAYPQKEICNSVKHIMDRTISNKVRFLLSATPLSCGVKGGVHSERIPLTLR